MNLYSIAKTYYYTYLIIEKLIYVMKKYIPTFFKFLQVLHF